METTTFTALAERAGRWWTVRVPQIEGLAVQVRSLEQAEMMARRHIAEVLRVPPESIRVDLRTEASMLPAVAQALQARQVAVRAAETAARATHAAIQALLADGSTFHEAAVILGLAPEEITEFTPRAQGGPGTRGTPGTHGAPGTRGAPGTPTAPGGHSAPGPRGGPAPHRAAEAERPVGPGGLPQRTRTPGPLPASH
jgi:hypothetical protein